MMRMSFGSLSPPPSQSLHLIRPFSCAAQGKVWSMGRHVRLRPSLEGDPPRNAVLAVPELKR
jgi:hypothetical protein